MRNEPIRAMAILAILLGSGTVLAGEYRLADVQVIIDEAAPPRVQWAAAELRAYAFQLTGVYPPLTHRIPPDKPAVALRVGATGNVPSDGPDPTQNYAIFMDNNAQVVQGASDTATLWAVYHLIETWGVGFYLGGDAVPAPNPDRAVSYVDIRQHPTLAIRGNLPWCNFLNSPTTWNPQDYTTFFTQMAKQRANFIGFHAYDHEPFGAYDITETTATMGGPLMTTISPHRWWSPHIMTTKDYPFGTDRFFNRGEWGCEVGIESAWTFAPGRSTRLQQQMMAEALSYAQQLGIKTCLGWEVNGNPDESAIREAFVKRLDHTLQTYPLDYFWIWQSEGRGTAGTTHNRISGPPNEGIAIDDDIRQAFAYLGPDHDLAEAARITRFIRLAHAELKQRAPDVPLIVSGWGGDKHMKFSTLYVGLDRVVPDDVIFAALDNIDPRLEPNVSAAYGQLKPTRPRWPIPWFESDAGHTRVDQTGPQTNVTAFEPLLKDIVAKGCQGALGIHWRTRNVEDVAGYLYRFGWQPDLTAEDYFTQYAGDRYLPDDRSKMAKVHLRLEEFGPQYVGAVGMPECASEAFWWFWAYAGPLNKDEPNLADAMPNPERFDELQRIAAEARAGMTQAASRGERDAAVAYHDLAHTIDWLVKRARVGMAIWGDQGALSRRLIEAETQYDAGKRDAARTAGRAILAELEQLDFRGACQSLATTCRTRGELGMLATANARYGRYYATFIERIARILGEPLHPATGPRPWTGEPTLIVYPVPDIVTTQQIVQFDLVAVPYEPGQRFTITLYDLARPDAPPQTLTAAAIGGACHRATWEPSQPGTWQWQVNGPDGFLASLTIPPETGVLSVRAP